MFQSVSPLAVAAPSQLAALQQVIIGKLGKNNEFLGDI